MPLLLKNALLVRFLKIVVIFRPTGRSWRMEHCTRAGRRLTLNELAEW